MNNAPVVLADRAISMLKQPAVAFGLSLLIVLWWGVLTLIEVERSANRRAIASDASNLSRVFEQNVIRSLSEIDKTLLYLRHSHEKMPGHANWSGLIKEAFTASDDHIPDRGDRRAGTADRHRSRATAAAADRLVGPRALQACMPSGRATRSM